MLLVDRNRRFERKLADDGVRPIFALSIAKLLEKFDFTLQLRKLLFGEIPIAGHQLLGVLPASPRGRTRTGHGYESGGIGIA